MAKADYGQALDELDQMHRSGSISDSRYEMHRQKLLAGARTDSSLLLRLVRAVWTAAAIVALLAVVALLVWLFT